MPRLSMWRENHSNDFKFFDRRISEEFTVGGVGVNLHKYLGAVNQTTAYTTTGNTSANTRVLYFSNVASFEVGQTLSGIGVAANTVIFSTNVTANTVTMTSGATTTISSGMPIAVY